MMELTTFSGVISFNSKQCFRFQILYAQSGRRHQNGQNEDEFDPVRSKGYLNFK